MATTTTPKPRTGISVLNFKQGFLSSSTRISSERDFISSRTVEGFTASPRSFLCHSLLNVHQAKWGTYIHIENFTRKTNAHRVKFFFFGVKKNVILWRKVRKLFVGLWVLPYICIISHCLLRWGRKEASHNLCVRFPFSYFCC